MIASKMRTSRRALERLSVASARSPARRALIPLSAIALLLGFYLLSGCKATDCLSHQLDAPGHGASAKIDSPLRVLAANPRYFTDRNQRAVYLTGSHTWLNFQDRTDGGRAQVNFTDYLDLLGQYNHNFIRLWVWEDARHTPLPFQRSGPGLARDGNPKFDLNELNPDFFNRLRARVMQARERGIYVSVMLFQGWSIESRSDDRDPWLLHPFHRDNNVNGVDGDADGDGEGRETHTLALAAIIEIQRRYVTAIIDTLNDLDNVLWEISNESPASSTEWQYSLIHFIRTEESPRPKQHPIGMTLQYGGEVHALLTSPADWISPGSVKEEEARAYRDDPPLSTGAKVIIADTDHLFSKELDPDASWVWKSFTRGYHPTFMDKVEETQWDALRRAMGDTLRYARHMDLKHMVPRGDLASSGYCLAGRITEHPELLVFLPQEIPRPDSWVDRIADTFESRMRASSSVPLEVTVDLSAVTEPLRVEWFSPAKRKTYAAADAQGGTRRSFTAPFKGPAVLYLSPR